MRFFNKINLRSTPLWCTALLLMLFSCCNDEPPKPPDKPPYKWVWENRDFIQINPYYEDGYYYVFSEPWTSNSWSLAKVKETNGEILYKVPIRDNVDVPKFECHFRDGDRLMLVEGNYIHQINMKNGSIVTDTFKNYIWNFLWTKDHISGCGWTDNYNTFKFFEIVYIDGHYREKQIHSVNYPGVDSLGNSRTNAGTPPVYTNGKWIMAYNTYYYSSQETRNYIITKEDSIVTYSSYYDNNKGNGFNSIKVDDRSMYVFSVDKLFAFDRSNGSLKWETPIEARSYSTIKDNNIYILDGSDAYVMNIINKETGQKEVLTQDPCWQGKIVGDYLCWVHHDLNKFNLKTKVTEFSAYIPISAVSNVSWGVPFGASEKSVLLHDGLKFECFPF